MAVAFAQRKDIKILLTGPTIGVKKVVLIAWSRFQKKISFISKNTADAPIVSATRINIGSNKAVNPYKSGLNFMETVIKLQVLPKKKGSMY